MKAILVIDMPVNGCESCMFDTYGCRCLIKANMLDIEKMGDSNYCPLKPMPKEEDIYEVGTDEEDTNAKRQWNKGWNACLKEIEK